MPYRLTVLLLVVFTHDLFCQTLPKDTLSVVLDDGIIQHIVDIPIVVPDTVVEQPVVDIKATHWNTQTINPYTNTLTPYPIELTFEDSTYASPVTIQKVVTSRYGWRRGRPHQGIDIDLVTGDTVVSMLSGIVRYAKYGRGHGNVVVVRHYNGLETTYAHLSDIAVKANDTVAKGQFIGKGGNTGHSTGSHLHLGVSYNGEYINPEYIFDFSESNTIRAKTLWVTRTWTHARYHNSRKQSKLPLYTTKDDALASMVKTKKIYVVQRGDTLSRISKRNNLSVASICKTNAIKKTAPLRVGQKLVLEL